MTMYYLWKVNEGRYRVMGDIINFYEILLNNLDGKIKSPARIVLISVLNQRGTFVKEIII